MIRLVEDDLRARDAFGCWTRWLPGESFDFLVDHPPLKLPMQMICILLGVA